MELNIQVFLNMSRRGTKKGYAEFETIILHRHHNSFANIGWLDLSLNLLPDLIDSNNSDHSSWELLNSMCCQKVVSISLSMLLQIWMLSTFIIFVENNQVIAIICSSQVHIELQIYQLQLIVIKNVLRCHVKWLRKQLEISWNQQICW